MFYRGSPMKIKYTLLLGTDTIFSSQTFHSQETGAVRQSRSPRRQRGVTTVVQAVAASAMTMAEGGRSGEVERGWMWQWMAALRADAAIYDIGVVGCCRRGGLQWRWRATVTVINNRAGGRAGEDRGESSDIFDYSVEPGGTIP